MRVKGEKGKWIRFSSYLPDAGTELLQPVQYLGSLRVNAIEKDRYSITGNETQDEYLLHGIRNVRDESSAKQFISDYGLPCYSSSPFTSVTYGSVVAAARTVRWLSILRQLRDESALEKLAALVVPTDAQPQIEISAWSDLLWKEWLCQLSDADIKSVPKDGPSSYFFGFGRDEKIQPIEVTPARTANLLHLPPQWFIQRVHSIHWPLSKDNIKYAVSEYLLSVITSALKDVRQGFQWATEGDRLSLSATLQPESPWEAIMLALYREVVHEARETVCPRCGKIFVKRFNQDYCSAACKQAIYRRRKKQQEES